MIYLVRVAKIGDSRNVHSFQAERVVRRKLFRCKLRFWGVGANGTKAHGQGREKAAKDDK